MHQFPRSPPVSSSPASSPRTNPMRTNNPRDLTDPIDSGRVTPRSLGDESAYNGTSDETANASVFRLNQIIQNLFCKAALTVLHNRVDLPPAYNAKGLPRFSKWFGIEIPDSDVLRGDYQLWKKVDIAAAQPPAMIVDVVISSKNLKSNENLVIHDEFGKVTSVEEAVKIYYEGKQMERKQSYEVVLERWQFTMDDFTTELLDDTGSALPKVYRTATVLFRSIFTMVHLLPAWNLNRKSATSIKHQFLPMISFRVYEKSKYPSGTQKEGLFIPLPDVNDQGLEHHQFDQIETPVGRFRAKVSYRVNCDIRIERSEAPLSSRIADSDLFKPSLGRQLDDFDINSRDLMPPPPKKNARDILRNVDLAQQAYGSLGTYHVPGPALSLSPLSTLRAARDLNATSTSPLDSPPIHKQLPEDRTSQDLQGSLRAVAVPSTSRRTSITFQPFKSPSLSASPSPLSAENMPGRRVPISTGTGSSALSALAQARKPASAQQPASVTPIPASTAPTRPTPKYSSSFSHRRSRNSVNLTRDDDGSSGRGSPRPGSGTGEANTSSGSLHADDDNITDFLKMLDSKKDLKSFRSPSESVVAGASSRRTTLALSKYSRLRESHAILSDSMSSSVVGHRSSSSSSRQLASVPPMVGGNSLSTASSPGERMSPRTPHTPAIPSRLSANSIIDYTTHRERGPGTTVPEDEEVEATTQAILGQGTGAIDIPSSPRVFQPSYRRSSSVSQQHRTMAFDDDLGDNLPFGNRSTSLGGNNEREPVSIERMLADAPSNPALGGEPMDRQQSTSSQGEAGSSSRGAYRFRGSVRGRFGAHGSSTSLTGDRGSASGGSDSRGGRHSFRRSRDVGDLEEDELLFAMSDFGVAQGRHSIEERRNEPPTPTRGARDSERTTRVLEEQDPPAWS